MPPTTQHARASSGDYSRSNVLAESYSPTTPPLDARFESPHQRMSATSAQNSTSASYPTRAGPSENVPHPALPLKPAQLPQLPPSSQQQSSTSLPYRAAYIPDPVDNNSSGTPDVVPSRPLFGISLEELYQRDETAVPMVVYQCLQAVDLFGLDVEGIYRMSGTATHITRLRTLFDNGKLPVAVKHCNTYLSPRFLSSRLPEPRKFLS